MVMNLVQPQEIDTANFDVTIFLKMANFQIFFTFQKSLLRLFLHLTKKKERKEKALHLVS